MNHIFKELKDEKGASFRIYTEIEVDTLRITILRNSSAWSANITKNDIVNLSDRVNVSSEKYLQNLANYFSSAPTNVSFKLHDQENEIIVFLKTEGGIKLKYFSFIMEQVDYFKCVDNLLYMFFKERTIYLSDAKQQNERHIALKKTNSILEKKLLELAERRQLEEQELFNSFMLILNEKKKRIQHLNELLDAFQGGRPTLNSPIVKKSKDDLVEVKDDLTQPVPSTSKCEDFLLLSKKRSRELTSQDHGKSDETIVNIPSVYTADTEEF